MQYNPSDTIKDAEVFRELQQVSKLFAQIPRLQVLTIAPVKPSDGDEAISDGVTWNPIGDGIKRPVWFDATAGIWKKFNV